jgi:hypothetical protein
MSATTSTTVAALAISDHLMRRLKRATSSTFTVAGLLIPRQVSQLIGFGELSIAKGIVVFVVSIVRYHPLEAFTHRA